MCCEKDTTAYRGLSFRTKKEYDNFKTLLDSGEYRPKLPESFSRIKTTAEEFARNKKTLFHYQDNNICLENSYKNITNENISVYAGIVIELIVPKGSGVDANKSEDCMEDEIIYCTTKKIKYKYEIIKSFENQLKENPFNINEYIQNKGLEDNFSKYIMLNHQNELTKETQLFVLQKILNPKLLNKKEKSYYLGEEKKVIAKELSGSISDNEEDVIISFKYPDILRYYKNGIFTDPIVLGILEKNVDNIIEEICEFVESEYNYGEREECVHYDLSYLMKTSHLASDNQRERLKSISYMANPRDINCINEEIRSLNYRKDLSHNEKERIVRNKTEELKKLLLSTINDLPKKRSLVEEEIEKQTNKNDEIKKKIKRLRNQ